MNWKPEYGAGLVIGIVILMLLALSLLKWWFFGPAIA